MRVYSTYKKSINGELASCTGFTVSRDLPADIYLIAREPKKLEDPAKYIKNPKTTLIVAGRDNAKGVKFGKIAKSCGVPEENIILVPEGVNFTINTLAEGLKRVAETAETTEEPLLEALLEEEESCLEPVAEEESLPKKERPATRKKSKIITFYGYKGGLGKTTFATALAAHFKDIGERVALIDLNTPPCAGYHFGIFPEGDGKNGFNFTETPYGDLYIPAEPYWSHPALDEIMNLRMDYGRIIVVYPPQPGAMLEGIKSDRVVIMVNSDMVQVVEPTAHINVNGIYIYNLAMPDIEQELVSEILGKEVVSAEPDPDGCQAALASGEPANRKSENITKAVGQLAALLDK
jgi:hypothetical protein